MKNSFKKVAALALAVLMLLMLVPASLAADGESVSNPVVPGLSDGGTLLTSLKKYSDMFEKLMAEEDPSAFAELAAQYMQDAGFLDWLENAVTNGNLASDQLEVLNARLSMIADGFGADTLAISGPTTVEVGASINLQSNSSVLEYRYDHEWSSSDTSVATVSGSESRATVTGVSEGTVTITHEYKTISGWNVVERSETYQVTVTARSLGVEALVYYLKTPTSNPNSNSTLQWGKALSGHGTVNTNGATWVNDKNVFNPAPYVTSMPGTAQGNGSYLLPKEGNEDHYQAVLDTYKDELEKDLGVELKSINDIEAIYLTPYKISKDNGTTPDRHIDCTISVKCKQTFLARFWVTKPNQEPALVDSKNYLNDSKIQETGNAPTGGNGSYPNEINIGGVVYVFDGWYNEADQKVADTAWPYAPSETELADGTVDFYAHYVPKTTTVTVTKTVDSNIAGDLDKVFNFSYKIDDENEESFTLKNGESEQISLNSGSKIVVTETADDDFSTKNKVDSNNEVTSNTATIENVQSTGQTIAFTNTRKMATLQVKKVLVDATNPDAQFNITVTYSLNGEEQTKTFTLGNNQSSEDFTVPIGTVLTITETDAGSYTTTAAYGTTTPEVTVNADGSRTFTVIASDAANEIVVTNTLKTGTLKVVKNVTGGLGERSKEFSFTCTYPTNNTTTFKLANGQSVSVAGIPYGTEVTITEDDYSSNNGGYTTSYKVDDATTATDSRVATVTINADETTVTFINDKPANPDTGVLLDSLPYILILAAIAVVAGVAVVRKRRARDDD